MKERNEIGLQIPYLSLVFILICILSEVTDAILLVDVLSRTLSSLPTFLVWIVSCITGSICFFSMAFEGFCKARNEDHNPIIGIIIWATLGIVLIWLRINSALLDFTSLKEFFQSRDVTMGILQIVLYLGTGFMTYACSKKITKAVICEYFLTKIKYKKNYEYLEDLKTEIMLNISCLRNYSLYTNRLDNYYEKMDGEIEFCKKEVEALVESKMACYVEPDIMDKMYKYSIRKSKSE